MYDEKERERKDCGSKRSGRFRVELTGGVAIVGELPRPGFLSGREEPRGQAQASKRALRRVGSGAVIPTLGTSTGVPGYLRYFKCS